MQRKAKNSHHREKKKLINKNHRKSKFIFRIHFQIAQVMKILKRQYKIKMFYF